MDESELNFCQCKITRNVEKGRQERVAYLPEEFAVVNEVVRLKIDEVWVDGWTVISVGAPIKGYLLKNKYFWREPGVIYEDW